MEEVGGRCEVDHRSFKLAALRHAHQDANRRSTNPPEKEPPAPPTLSVSSRPVISLFGLLQSGSSDESYARKLA